MSKMKLNKAMCIMWLKPQAFPVGQVDGDLLKPLGVVFDDQDSHVFAVHLYWINVYINI